MKIGRITQLTMKPLQCSQGGVPFNKPHLDAATAEIDRLRARIAELEAERDRLRGLVNDAAEWADRNGKEPWWLAWFRAELEGKG